MYPQIHTMQKGLLKAAIRDDDPVIFMESEQMYGDKMEQSRRRVHDSHRSCRYQREGSDVTVVSFGKIIKEAYKAAEALEKEGISIEIIDLRTVRPMDHAAIVASVKKLTVSHSRRSMAIWKRSLRNYIQNSKTKHSTT